jgi:hypothetical protein
MVFTNAVLERFTRPNPLLAVENPTITCPQYPLLGLCSQGAIPLPEDYEPFFSRIPARSEGGFSVSKGIMARLTTVVIARISHPGGILHASTNG